MKTEIRIIKAENGWIVETNNRRAVALGYEMVADNIARLAIEKPTLPTLEGSMATLYIDTDKGIDHHINEVPQFTVLREEEDGVAGVRVQALGEDFVIALHDAADGKNNFTYDSAMEWLKEHNQQTFTRRQAGIIAIYIVELNELLKSAGGDAFADDWYVTNELYCPAGSSADYYANGSWCFLGAIGCFSYAGRFNGCFRCRPSLAYHPS